MPTTFVCLDTNILYRYATQGQMVCEPEHWLGLLDLIAQSKVNLLMPEVVALEFEKLSTTDFETTFAAEMKDLRSHLRRYSTQYQARTAGRSCSTGTKGSTSP